MVLTHTITFFVFTFPSHALRIFYTEGPAGLFILNDLDLLIENQ